MESKQHKIARAVIRDVLESTESVFYRNHFEKNEVDIGEIKKEEYEWEKIPLLTRNDVQEMTVKERMFRPWSDLDALRVTSGTSGFGVIVVPRMGQRHDRRSPFYNAYIRALNPKKMASFSGAQFLYEGIFREYFGVHSLYLEGSDMHVSASMLRQYRPDMLAGFVYALNALMPHISDEIAQDVRSVQLFGEWCSTLQWQEIGKRFPNARRVSEYSSVESQSVLGVPCVHLIEEGQKYIHPIPEYALIEIIDSDTGEIKNTAGERGEIVVTVLRPVAFPLIRYKTGDIARIVHTRCPCGVETPVLSIEGRIEIDRIRISGGEINLAEADRAISHVGGIIEPEFEIRYTEFPDVRGLMQHHITVALRFDESRTSEDILAREIMAHFRVSPNMTYAEGVLKGLYAPLSVAQLDQVSGLGKRRRIIRAIS